MIHEAINKKAERGVEGMLDMKAVSSYLKMLAQLEGVTLNEYYETSLSQIKTGTPKIDETEAQAIAEAEAKEKAEAESRAQWEFYDFHKALDNCETATTLYFTGLDKVPFDGISRLKKLKKLKLGNFFIDSIPEEVFELTNLEILESYNCCFSLMPKAMKNLVNLKEFTCTGGKHGEGFTESLLSALAPLHNLQSIFLPSYHFAEIPPVLFKLLELHYLGLYDNNLNAIPGEITTFKKLKGLYLSSNRIEKVPDEVGELKSLRVLGLSDNPIKVLPESICNLTDLESIGLENTKISELPADICSLTAITSIELKGTELKELPENIGNLTKLKCLGLPPGIKSLPASLANCPQLRIATPDEGHEHMRELVKKAGLEIRVTTY